MFWHIRIWFIPLACLDINKHNHLFDIFYNGRFLSKFCNCFQIVHCFVIFHHKRILYYNFGVNVKWIVRFYCVILSLFLLSITIIIFSIWLFSSSQVTVVRFIVYAFMWICLREKITNVCHVFVVMIVCILENSNNNMISESTNMFKICVPTFKCNMLEDIL